jgi:hypothetical protein
MINKEYRDFKELEERAIQEKLKKLNRYAKDLNLIGYYVIISACESNRMLQVYVSFMIILFVIRYMSH